MEPVRQPAGRTNMRIVLLALAMLVASSCGGAANRSPDITGFITSVGGRADGVTVLVESDPSQPSIGDKASVAVTTSTRITRRSQGGGEVAATARELVPGLQVQVWFDGPVATSYPVQGKAQALVIVR